MGKARKDRCLKPGDLVKLSSDLDASSLSLVLEMNSSISIFALSCPLLYLKVAYEQDYFQVLTIDGIAWLLVNFGDICPTLVLCDTD